MWAILDQSDDTLVIVRTKNLKTHSLPPWLCGRSQFCGQLTSCKQPIVCSTQVLKRRHYYLQLSGGPDRPYRARLTDLDSQPYKPGIRVWVGPDLSGSDHVVATDDATEEIDQPLLLRVDDDVVRIVVSDSYDLWVSTNRPYGRLFHWKMEPLKRFDLKHPLFPPSKTI